MTLILYASTGGWGQKGWLLREVRGNVWSAYVDLLRIRRVVHQHVPRVNVFPALNAHLFGCHRSCSSDVLNCIRRLHKSLLALRNQESAKKKSRLLHHS